MTSSTQLKMQNRIKVVAAAIVLLIPFMAHADSSGLYLNNDSVQIPYNLEPAPLFGLQITQSYNFLYSQAPFPHNLLLSTGFEFVDEEKEFWDNNTITPKVDLMLMKFMGGTVTAVGVGFVHRLAATESHTFNILSTFTISPQLTTMGQGKYLWGFSTQLNYPFTDDVEFNFGYRNMTVQLLSNVENGFERGIYFGMTTFFE